MIPSKGLSRREGSMSTINNNEVIEHITFDNVHKCSTYQLRQELKKHGYYPDNYQGRINHNILLEKMVQILHQNQMKEEEESFKNSIQSTSTEETLQERLTREKNTRKALALERSQLRQSDANYFKSKKELNDSSVVANPGEVKEDSKKEEVEDDSDDSSMGIKVAKNPFAPTFKSRVGGKCS